MLEIKNTNVYNLEEALRASGNSMRLEPVSISGEPEDISKSLERCIKLAKLGGGSGNSNFRTGILVTFDLKYSQYITKQMQRYHFFQYVNSTSLMHRITRMDFSKCCNKYASDKTIKQMEDLIYWYNLLSEASFPKDIENIIWKYQNFVKDNFKNSPAPIENNIQNHIYDCYMRIISNCPMGCELWVHCSTNYEQLATIYKQRKNHKLKEDWGEFCSWIEKLPYAKELIICE